MFFIIKSDVNLTEEISVNKNSACGQDLEIKLNQNYSSKKCQFYSCKSKSESELWTPSLKN